jgi:tetratricopeptide (TPR) repeat protein
MTEKKVPSLLKRRPAWLWVFLAVFVFQFLLVCVLSRSRHFIPDSDDMRFYRDWARKISGELPWKPGEANYPGTAFYGMPGYAYALTGLYGLTGGYDPELSPLIVGLLQALFHAGTATFLFLIARRIFGGTKLASAERKDTAGILPPPQTIPDGSPANARGTLLGALAAISWAAFTPAQVFSAIHMPTAWVICAFWGLLYWLICLHQSRRATWWNPWLWIGLILGVVAMLVASVLMLLPLVIAAIFLMVSRGQGIKRRLFHSVAAIAVLFVGFYAGCSPCWSYNHFVAKDRVLFSAHDGLNFYVGNHKDANGYTKIPEGLRSSQEGMLTDSLTIPQQELGTGKTIPRSVVSQFWKDKAHLWISTNRFAWLQLLGIKVDNFWNTFQYDDLSILRLLRSEGLIPPGLRWGQFSPFALVGLFFALCRWPRLRWVAAAVLLLLMALLPVFVTERYRLIAAPGLILLALGGLAWLWEKIASRALVPAAAYLMVLAGASWWTTRPRPDIGLWSLDFYKAGIRATDAAMRLPPEEEEYANQLSRAKTALERAYAYVPQNAEVLFALGNLWTVRGDPAKAVTCFLAALDLNPRHDAALANLAQVYSDRSQWKDALPYMERATELAPENYKRWYALSLIYKGLGDAAKARESATRALSLLLPIAQAEPRNPERWSTLAQVYQELGDRPAALDAIRRARTLLPEHQALQKIEQEIMRVP